MTDFLTALGAAIAIFLSSAGASLGSIPAGVFALRANRTWGWKSFIPIVIAGVLAIYGLIIAVILCGNVDQTEGYKHLCAGLAVGSACLASGLGIGKFIHIQTPESKSILRIAPPPPNHCWLMAPTILWFRELKFSKPYAFSHSSRQLLCMD